MAINPRLHMRQSAYQLYHCISNKCRRAAAQRAIQLAPKSSSSTTSSSTSSSNSSGTIASSFSTTTTCSSASSSTSPHARPLIILGIESSCDDTAAAVVSSDGRVLGEALATQADLHAPWGGVVPSLAQQAHRDAINRIVDSALTQASLTAHDLDAVAVTVGPGLSLCLDVGVRKARAVSREAAVPLVPVHHMEVSRLSWKTQAVVGKAGSRSQGKQPCLFCGALPLMLTCTAQHTSCNSSHVSCHRLTGTAQNTSCYRR